MLAAMFENPYFEEGKSRTFEIKDIPLSAAEKLLR
jgi:hypothetical protein